MTAEQVGFALIVLGILLLAGKFLRLAAPPLQRLFMPSSVIAGVFGLLLGPEVLGRLAPGFRGANGLFPEYVVDVWTTLPVLLINVIFAGLFLGKKIPGVREVWMVAGPQVAFGQTLAWGQYVVGITLALVVLTPLLGAPPMAGALIEIGFQGGHGTAAGLEDTFEQVGFEEATDLALGLATVGVVSGLVFGVWAIQWGTRRGYSNVLDRPSQANPQDLLGVADPSDREAAGWLTTRSSSIDVLTLSAAYLGFAILLGQLLLEGLVLVEAYLVGSEFMTYVPLFPLAMIGGLILQLLLSRFDRFKLLDRGMVIRIQNLALDLLIVSAVATLSLTVLGENLAMFFLLATAGVAWNVFVFVKLARRMIPEYWFERGIGDTGQSLGMTATGLLLIRMADPDHKSPAMEAFGYKQLLFEPIVGGGLFTAISVPLIFEFGPLPILGIASVLMVGFMSLGLLYFGRSPRPPDPMD
ncbi:MAG: sodium:glutamate symporter [Wenzhouxiangellaceae bacterium]|nr:sodium:glutamate symporter [Wenzhouxiangellaceae bacterium]MBS3822391.1 sodium:glutamate symporter [Wenzhouxiangellaceae bacterium]